MEPVNLDHRQLAQASFALLDPLQGGDPELAAWSAWNPQSIVPQAFPAQARQMPRLVDLGALSPVQHGEMAALMLNKPAASAAACVGLLYTDVAIERLLHWGMRRVAPHFVNGQRGIFRFHDPVVFEHLTWILSDAEMVSLLGPIQQWALPIRGEWQAQQVGLAAGVGSHFHLHTATWERIERIGVIHAVLQIDPVWSSDPARWGPPVEALLARAEAHQLSDPDDAVAFACQGMRHHPALDKHPEVAAVLADSVGHPSRYRRKTGAWSAEQWQSIVAELKQSQGQEQHVTNMTSSTQGVCG